MESILLGALAFTGYNSSKVNKKEKKPNYNRNELDSSYNSNMENAMNKVEKFQASSLKNNQPEYFKQFDDLTFDSISEPVTIADAHITITGLDSGLQKNINLYNGYSNIKDDLNYKVVSKEHFTHKNMTPNSSRRDYTIDDSRASRRLEAFTGVNDNWVPKQEKYPLFEPMKNLTYVNGMPVFTDYLDDRYLASNKNNNGNLPFKNNVFVKPGLENENRQGLGTVYRVNPRTTDALRSENNPKISYINKPLETIKKGDMRGPDFNITKYKLPDFRETKFTDLVANKGEITGRIKTGKFTNMGTQRNETDVYYPGHATNSNMGDGPDLTKTSFEPAKRQELYNDPTHAVNAVNVRPVFLNEESYTNRENQRSTANYSQNGTVSFTNGGSWAPYTDIARKTIRESSSHDVILGSHPENTGPNAQYTDQARKTIRQTTSHDVILGSHPENTGPNVQYTDQARKTIRQTTSHDVILGANPENSGPNAQYADQARKTIRETTSHDVILGANPENSGPSAQYADIAKETIREGTSHNMILGASAEVAKPNVEYSDKAKPTIKETTLYTTPGMNVASSIPVSYKKDDKDIAKTTIRQTTENTQYEGHLHGTDNYSGYVRDARDKARTTVKETTLLTDYTGGVSWPVERPESHIASDNMTIRETREISTYNRPANGGTDRAGPQFNKETLRPNCRKETVYYVSHPSRPLDQTIMPSSSEAYKNQIFENKKPQLSYGNYYTNNAFINTLNQNPYVNDLHHQKNVQYNDYKLSK